MGGGIDEGGKMVKTLFTVVETQRHSKVKDGGKGSSPLLLGTIAGSNRNKRGEGRQRTEINRPHSVSSTETGSSK